MGNHNKKPEATEEEYLRYFFDNAKIPIQERVFLEEGFELCYNAEVPKALRIDLTQESQYMDTRDTEPSPPMISSNTPTPIVEVTPDEGIEIPKPPKMPELTMMGKVLLDRAERGDYVLIHKGSGEHVSLTELINQLKDMTGM
jgi:hypothetical protein